MVSLSPPGILFLDFIEMDGIGFVASTAAVPTTVEAMCTETAKSPWEAGRGDLVPETPSYSQFARK
jgi:hypothetical protein